MRIVVSENKARNVLLAIWSLSFVTSLAITFYLHLHDTAIEADYFNTLVTRLNSLYVTYLGVMIAFYLTRGNIGANEVVTTPATEGLPGVGETSHINSNVPFVIAASGSIAWNVVILLFVGRLLFGLGYVEDAISQVETYGSLLSWIVAPAIGFYFGNISKSR